MNHNQDRTLEILGNAMIIAGVVGGFIIIAAAALYFIAGI